MDLNSDDQEPVQSINTVPSKDPSRESPKKRKKSKLFKVLRFFIVVFIIIPLIIELVFFLMRIAPGTVIPDTFFVYAKISQPRAFSSRFLEHESLPELLTNPDLASLTPALSSIRASGMLEKSYVRFALRGSISAALVNTPGAGTREIPKDGNSYIAAWDSSFLAPLLRLAPIILRFVKVPNLYYVQSSGSRYEYRSGENTVYLGLKRNLLVASDNEELFTRALSPEGASNASEKKITLTKQDLSILISSKTVTSMMGDDNPLLANVFTQVKFPDFIEMGINIEPKQLNISLVTPAETDNAAFAALLSGNSLPPSLMNILPESTQYCTSLSSMGLREVINAVAELEETGLKDTLNTADKAAKTLLGLTVEDLLYSWSADEFAVFGLQDRPTPVFAIKIGDEAKRKAVFDKAFRSAFLKEDTRLMLDGNRIPQIELPVFVDAILKIIHVTVPRPYYTVHDGWLILSESPENILSTVTELRQGQLLAKTATWHKLSENNSAATSLTMYYSLNRSLPFFLTGGSAAASVLRMYRQGLMKLSVKDHVLTLILAAEPGSGKGLESMPGYPINIGKKTGNTVYAIVTASGSESRLLLSRDTAALAVNPADHTIYELNGDDPVWVIPAEGLTVKTMKDSVAWVISSRGLVTLVNGNMEAASNFPVITGLKLSSAPAAYNGLVYLFSEEAGGRGVIHTVDAIGHINKLETEFGSPILSPPLFIERTGTTSRGLSSSLMALYPKSFLGEIFLCDPEGNPRSPPLTVPGIAFGSPLPFRADTTDGSSHINIAFITMAGELSVFDEEGLLLPGFPLEINGVFYVQPAWDGQYLWIVSEEGILFRIDPEENSINRIMEQKAPDLMVKENGFIMIVDVDGDSIPEIFISGEGNAIYGYTRNMVSIDGFPLSAWGRPAFADLDGDGIMDCVAAGMDNKLYRWRFRTGQ